MESILIAGLGNPGSKYSKTRHNIGYWVIDTLVSRWKLEKPAARFEGEFWAKSERLLLKPTTFMNLSGTSVLQATQFYKVNVAERFLVVSDDLELPAGTLRLRKEGGDGGHNGLKSIIEVFGSENFPRLRIGIGRGPGDASSHVLGKISKEEEVILSKAVDQGADAVETWLNEGITVAMNRFNGKGS